MLYPSIDQLKEKIDSKYALVTLAAKRAREMQEEGLFLLEKEQYQAKQHVGQALEEIAHGVLSHNELSDEEDRRRNS